MKVLLLFIGLGLVTFFLRFSFIGMLGKREIPHTFRLALNFVPLAVLTAIIVPEVVMSGDKLISTWMEPKLYAAMVAIGVAAKTKKVLPTLVGGMIAFWLLRWWLGA